MNTPTEENLFEITLSQEGANYLLRTFKIARWLLGIASLASVVFTLLAWLRFMTFKKYDTGSSTMLYFQLRIDPFILFVVGILTFFQVFYYFRFAARCRKSIEIGQSEGFNASFKWLFRHAAITLFLFGLNVAMCIFYCYVAIDGFLKASNPA